jgi:hypothetical protein
MGANIGAVSCFGKRQLLHRNGNGKRQLLQQQRQRQATLINADERDQADQSNQRGNCNQFF